MRKIKIERILKIFFLVYSVSILIFTIFITNPIIMGDGQEYIGMTVSFFNHLTPDLKDSDVEMIKNLENKNQMIYDPGYYVISGLGKKYAVHFWMYSLFNLPVFSLLHVFNLNELKSFQITNSLLLILSLWMIIYLSNLPINKKVWFSLFASFNPVLFYIKWPHSEVFSYSFVLMATIFLLRKNYKISILMSSIASLQNPPIIILTLWLTLYGWMNKKWKFKELIYLLIPFFVSTVSYIFYYWNYHRFSAIAVLHSNGQWAGASLDNISINSILSFFFDLNLGMLPYIPLLLLISIFALISSIKRKDYFFVPSLWLVLFLMALLASTTIALNHGMMYINRYVIWMIPLIILITIYSLKYYESNKKLNIILFLTVITTASITGILLNEYDGGAYVKFNYISKAIIIYAPNLYNPPYEIFTKRTTPPAGDFYSEFWPIVYMYDGKPRKILTDYKDIDNFKLLDISSTTYNEIKKSRVGYINFGTYLFKWPIEENKISIYYKKDGDIVTDLLFNLNDRWEPIEYWNNLSGRFMSNDGIISFFYMKNQKSNLSLDIGSAYRPRSLNIYLNDKLINKLEINNTFPVFKKMVLSIELDKGENNLRFYTPDDCQYIILNNTNGSDNSCVSFAFQNITIN